MANLSWRRPNHTHKRLQSPSNCAKPVFCFFLFFVLTKQLLSGAFHKQTRHWWRKRLKEVISAISAIIRLSPPVLSAQLVMSVYTKAPTIPADKLGWLSRDHDALRQKKKKKSIENSCLFCMDLFSYFFTTDQGDTDIFIRWDLLFAYKNEKIFICGCHCSFCLFFVCFLFLFLMVILHDMM